MKAIKLHNKKNFLLLFLFLFIVLFVIFLGYKLAIIFGIVLLALMTILTPIHHNKSLGFNDSSTRLNFLKLLRSFAGVVLVVFVFFAGYQLAIYQEAKGDNLLPHIVVNNAQTNCNSMLQDCCPGINCFPTIDKPVIYLYPSHAEIVNVKVFPPTGFSTSIPFYNQQNGWNVIAKPDGTLTNLSEGTTYPYLYWEGNPAKFNFDMTKGFVVQGNQTKVFLTKELTQIGLNNSEISSFLEYWVPRMQNNKYTLIHFASSDYTDLVKLSINPKPDSLLRVFMVEEPLNQPVKTIPQSFSTFHRYGFTAVEWGGTEL